MKNQDCKLDETKEKAMEENNLVTAKTSAEQKLFHSRSTKIKTVENINKMTIESVRTTKKFF